MKLKKIIITATICCSFFINTMAFDKKEVIYNDKIEKILIDKIVNENFEYPHYEVGSAFLSGKILKRDYTKALFWLAQSSEIESNNKADFLLAEIYSKGLLDKNMIDLKKGMFFYERSAERGNSEAKLKAAVNFLYNDSVLNKEKGFYWLNNSMKDDNLTAHQLYSALIITNDDAKTILKQLDFVSIRSEKGDHLSSLYLGLVYLKNNIIKRDLSKSKMYFLRSMNQGNLIAEELLIQIDKIQNTLAK